MANIINWDENPLAQELEKERAVSAQLIKQRDEARAEVKRLEIINEEVLQANYTMGTSRPEPSRVVWNSNSMQNIPRNQLLDKLAAGWKVRRKGWGSEKDYPSISKKSEAQIKLWQYLEDDWQGEPSLPELKVDRCCIEFAFNELKNQKAKFIRRAAWKPTWKCVFNANHSTCLNNYELSLDDILSSDWEVWE
jgi:hypothetical protein